MKGLIWSFILASVVTSGCYAIGNAPSTEHQNITYNVGRVVSLGQCKGDTCSYSYTDQYNTLQYGSTDKPVNLGQLVYQQCWYEEAKGNQCYVNYEPSKN